MIGQFLFTHGKSHAHNPFPPSIPYVQGRDSDFCHLLQIICAALLLDKIKHGLGTEPAGSWRSNSLVRKCCVFVIDLYRLVTSASSSGIRHQLRVTAFFKAHEPKHCGFNGPTDRQEAVVLEKSGLFVSQGVCNLFALFRGKDNAVEC